MSSAFRTSSSTFVAFVSLLLFLLVPNLGLCEPVNNSSATIVTNVNSTSHSTANKIDQDNDFPPPLPKSLSTIVTFPTTKAITANNSGQLVDDDDNFDFDHNQTHQPSKYLSDFLMPDYVNTFNIFKFSKIAIDDC